MTKTYDLPPSKKAKTKKKAAEPLTPFVRSHAPCPACGYRLASVNETKGTIHCHACHTTGTWPPPVPAIVRLTDVLRDLFDDYQGDGSSASTGKTTFGVPFDGEEFIVEVRYPR